MVVLVIKPADSKNQIKKEPKIKLLEWKFFIEITKKLQSEGTWILHWEGGEIHRTDMQPYLGGCRDMV